MSFYYATNPGKSSGPILRTAGSAELQLRHWKYESKYNKGNKNKKKMFIHIERREMKKKLLSDRNLRFSKNSAKFNDTNQKIKNLMLKKFKTLNVTIRREVKI